MQYLNSPVTRLPRFVRLSVLGMVVLLLGALFPAATVTRAAVPFTPAACPIPAIGGIRIDCGYLTVAESRRNFTGKTIQLAVAILRSPNPNKAADPAVFLQGGPGGATISLAPLLVSGYAPTLAQRDIILMDQRGTGFSKPRLDCATDVPTIGKLALPVGIQRGELPDFIQAQADLLISCGQAYRAAGIDLSSYNSVENAADYEDLRIALGYGPWNVIGASYGTRLALTMLRYRPDTIRSLVLDSPYPLQANFQIEAFSSYNRALTQLAADCAAEPACNKAYPNLLQTFDSLYERLNTNAAQVPIIDPQTQRVITYLPISGVTFSSVIFQLSYITPVVSLLPLLIGETGKGNYAPFGALLGLLLTASPDPTDESTTAIGMFTAVQCNEDVPFASKSDFIKARDENRRASALAFQIIFNEGFLDVCAGIGLNNPDPAENQPVTSDKPVMIISGTSDPIIPPQYAEQTASTLPNSFIVSYPRGGHVPSADSPCLAAAVASYINTPGSRPNTACIAQEAPRPFVTPASANRHGLGKMIKKLSRTLPAQLQ